MGVSVRGHVFLRSIDLSDGYRHEPPVPCTGPEMSAWSTKRGRLLLAGEVKRTLKNDGLSGTQEDDGMSWGEDVGQRDRELRCVV